MAEQNLGTYSALDVQVIITQESTGLSYRVVGFMEDSVVTVTPTVDRMTPYNGADATGARIVSGNTSASIVLTLQQTSPSNDVLTQLHQRDTRSRRNEGLFSVMVKDASGRSVVSARQAYIGKLPEMAFTNGMSVREWTIYAFNAEMYVGGNSLMLPDEVDALELLEANVDQSWVDA